MISVSCANVFPAWLAVPHPTVHLREFHKTHRSGRRFGSALRGHAFGSRGERLCRHQWIG